MWKDLLGTCEVFIPRSHEDGFMVSHSEIDAGPFQLLEDRILFFFFFWSRLACIQSQAVVTSRRGGDSCPVSVRLTHCALIKRIPGVENVQPTLEDRILREILFFFFKFLSKFTLNQVPRRDDSLTICWWCPQMSPALPLNNAIKSP